MTRVQIPAYTDRWMMGDRYGDLLRITKGRRSAIKGKALIAGIHGDTDVAHVKLDKSGKTVRVILADCEVL